VSNKCLLTFWFELLLAAWLALFSLSFLWRVGAFLSFNCGFVAYFSVTACSVVGSLERAWLVCCRNDLFWVAQDRNALWRLDVGNSQVVTYFD
jgi:hypothetical protein